MVKLFSITLMLAILIGCTVAATDYCDIQARFCGKNHHVTCNNTSGVS